MLPNSAFIRMKMAGVYRVDACEWYLWHSSPVFISLVLFILSFVFWTGANAWIHCISVAQYLCCCRCHPHRHRHHHHRLLMNRILFFPSHLFSLFSWKAHNDSYLCVSSGFSLFIWFCVIWSLLWCWLWFCHSKSFSREIDNVDIFVFEWMVQSSSVWYY